MRFDSNVIVRAKQIKLIMQFGVGLEGVDIDAATKNGIKVARIPGDPTGNAASCAEMAIYLNNEMLISVKQKTLEEPTGHKLLGKTDVDVSNSGSPFGEYCSRRSTGLRGCCAPSEVWTVGGLGMDVGWREPLDPADPILKFNNVILTPLVSGITEHSCRSMA
ncbi:D-isomer specific 2-hydroxyacid dehydrogenase family protein isoform 2 [Hibiscus syriacus]|uniref:D-isomer specific 2-hydroxyacid dehydrogenase family protein isoform 2 n=1 Tax=Hibiscus syriacus TaxID=106335 RepID=A0A6A3CPA8_HIBSY|nr:D-isomer specific 2-hydroxyacid dehydrogenase family protein isoform 2 [Hibiscus syriacus]